MLVKLVCFWYHICFFLYTNAEKFGQQVVPQFSTNYIYPVIYCLIVAYSLMTIIPFVLLRFFKTPYSTYPMARNGNEKSLIWTLFMNDANIFSLKFSTDIIARSICYFHYCFYKSSLIENLTEKLLAITYFAALFFTFSIWGISIKYSYNGVLDTIAMWKFAILQKRQGHDLQV